MIRASWPRRAETSPGETKLDVVRAGGHSSGAYPTSLGPFIIIPKHELRSFREDSCTKPVFLVRSLRIAEIVLVLEHAGTIPC